MDGTRPLTPMSGDPLHGCGDHKEEPVRLHQEDNTTSPAVRWRERPVTTASTVKASLPEPKRLSAVASVTQTTTSPRTNERRYLVRRPSSFDSPLPSHSRSPAGVRTLGGVGWRPNRNGRQRPPYRDLGMVPLGRCEPHRSEAVVVLPRLPPPKNQGSIEKARQRPFLFLLFSLVLVENLCLTSNGYEAIGDKSGRSSDKSGRSSDKSGRDR